MMGRLFLLHGTGALGVRRDVFEALYYTHHKAHSQQRTVSRLETHVTSKPSGFQVGSASVVGGIPIRRNDVRNLKQAEVSISICGMND